MDRNEFNEVLLTASQRNKIKGSGKYFLKENHELIEEAINKQCPLKLIWQGLTDAKRINIDYSTFVKYTSKYIRKNSSEPKKPEPEIAPEPESKPEPQPAPEPKKEPPPPEKTEREKSIEKYFKWTSKDLKETFTEEELKNILTDDEGFYRGPDTPFWLEEHPEDLGL